MPGRIDWGVYRFEQVAGFPLLVCKRCMPNRWGAHGHERTYEVCISLFFVTACFQIDGSVLCLYFSEEALIRAWFTRKEGSTASFIDLNKCALPEFSKFSWDAGGAVSEMGGNEVVRYMDLTKLEFLFYLLPDRDVLVSMPTRPIATVHFIVSSFVYVLCVWFVCEKKTKPWALYISGSSSISSNEREGCSSVPAESLGNEVVPNQQASEGEERQAWQKRYGLRLLREFWFPNLVACISMSRY